MDGPFPEPGSADENTPRTGPQDVPPAQNRPPRADTPEPVAAGRRGPGGEWLLSDLEEDEQRNEAARRQRRKRQWRRALAWVGGALAVVLLLTGGGVAWAYFHLTGNIRHEKADAGSLGTSRPPKVGNATNILLLGSDSRAGTDGEYGADQGENNSDTIILLHIAPGGGQATAISFPRDSMVKVPACEQSKTQMSKPYLGMLNSAFGVAGPLCTWKTLEQDTGIHIDHFVEIDFSGFKRVVDALGGVQICLPEPVKDPMVNLDLPAGKQVVKGDQALAYVRERYQMGDGSDLGRIKRQQQFLSSVVRKALSTGVLTNPFKEYKFLDAATKSITTDDGLTMGKLKDLAKTVKGINSGAVQFITVPNRPYPKDPNRVQWMPDAAKSLFLAISQDTNLPVQPSALSESNGDPRTLSLGDDLTAISLAAATTPTPSSTVGTATVTCDDQDNN